ncbi:MAG: XdhC family protein [Spirulinaceae cyanobacterium RM2_2_10]|nr:XdhC family protein [Spirulinaceae cyanobacterium SM2_1_0]NJO21024.1 XdhC family protein [Spirulinaceae cyanobacterium RM2_2_10]
MTENFYPQLESALQLGPVVVAIIADSRGSVPREVGAMLAVAADGRCWGTIGGGAGEARVIAAAQQVLRSGEKQWVEIDLSGAPDRPTQGVCGGWLRVWLERWSGPAAIALVRDIQARLTAGHSAQLAFLLASDRRPQLLAADADAPADCALVVLLQPAPTLLIVGAGHVAVPLAQIAALAGFRIAVQDERPEFACAERFPAGAQIFAGAATEAIACLAPITSLYAALVTRSVEYDCAALTLLLQRSPTCCYLGAIGSRQRVQVLKRALAATGATAAQLASLHAPIGLDLGALTPAEIAVSIVAELVQVRRGGQGLPLACTARA